MDVSETAVACGERRSNAANVSERMQLVVGGISDLVGLAEEGNLFDVIICRDMYYLLDKDEQEEFWRCCNRLLDPSGLLHLSDLAVHRSLLKRLASVLTDRQFGGDPISWHESMGFEDHRHFSIEEQAERHGFVFERGPKTFEDAVAESYSTASIFASDVSLSAVYAEIGDIARLDAYGKSAVPYLRFYFRKVSQSAEG
jgi:hypothetical protein